MGKLNACAAQQLHCFSITAHRTNVGLRDVDTTIDNQFSMTISMPFVLPGSDRDRCMSAQVGEQQGVILISRFFKSGDVIGLNQLAKLQRAIK
jgi:hypothetical protein